MYALALLLFTASLVSGSSISRVVDDNDTEEGFLNPRVVDGSYSENKTIYREALIKYNNFPVCGGSFIEDCYVLTAAHCIYGKNPESITIFVGIDDAVRDVPNFNARALIWPSSYDEIKGVDDIGLIHLNECFLSSPTIKNMPLSISYYVPADETAVVTGWGRKDAKNPAPPTAGEEIEMTVISQPLCESYFMVTKNDICTYTKSHDGACHAVPGSPLVWSGAQIGIASYGSPCATGYPDVYTRVYPYKSWIAEVTNAGNRIHLNSWISLLLVTSTLMSYSYSLS